MRRRALVAGALALGLAAAVAGCGGSTAAPADGKTELTFSMWVGSTEDETQWQKVADDASAALGDVRIKLQGATFNEYFTKTVMQMAGDDVPCIVALQSPRLKQLKDGVRPLDDLVAGSGLDLSEFDQSMIEGLSVDGRLYGLPYDTGPNFMYYNKDAFAAAGVPEPRIGWTTDEFMDAARWLRDAGWWAIAPSPASAQDLILSYNGGRIVTPSGGTDFTNPEFIRGLQWLSDLTVVEKVAPQYPGGDYQYATDQFKAGKTAMYVEGAWVALDLKSKAQFRVGVTTSPAGPGGGSTYNAGSGFGVSKVCPTPEKAFAAIKEMTSERSLAGLAAAGRAYPARMAVQQIWADGAGIPGVGEVLRAAAATAVPAPSSRYTDQLTQLLNQYLVKVFNGQQPPADVMQEISSQIPKG